MKAKRTMVAAFLLLFLSFAAFCDETSHVIQRLQFHITGLTTEQALRTFLSISPPLREGVELPSADALAALLERKRQDMVNDRVFKSVAITDEAGTPENGKTPHTVTITAEDAFSLFPLPYPSYDSNSGLELGVETHYDNALGTMTNWYLDTYIVMRDRGGVFGVGPWRIHPKISMLVLAGIPFTLDVLIDRQENDRIDLGVLVADWACYRVSAVFSTFNLANDWYVTPEIQAASSFGFEDFLPAGSVFNRDLFAGPMTATLGNGPVNWTGNFRTGFDFNVAASASALDRNDVFNVTGEIDTTGTWYLPWSILDYYGRVHAQYDINDEPGNLGSWLRGIADSTMSGGAGVFTNQTLAIDVVPWKGVLDLQVHPFVDAGIVFPTSRAFTPSSDVRVGAGADVCLFIDVISNFLIRCTVGMDLTSAAPLDNIEVILNTGLSY